MTVAPTITSAEDIADLPCRNVRCISDIHVDIEENRDWLAKLPAHPEDILLVAGDLSDNLARARDALRVLKGKYKEVLCVPGNHDLWLNKDWTENDIKDSMEKLKAFLSMCRDEGVRTTPLVVDGAGGSCVVVPILSWHHQSWDTEPDITCWKGIPAVEKCMVDYMRCKWPAPLSAMDDSVAAAVDRLNDGGPPLPEEAGTEFLPIISFSHFVPRLELNPEKRFLFLPTLAKAVGSRFLEKRIRKLQSTMHVFGHTHFGWDATLDGTRYVQAALGYPQEWQTRRMSMEIGNLYEEPIILWSSSSGFVPPMRARWSSYYQKFPRKPSITHALAPYVASAYTRVDGGEICEWPPKGF